MQFLFSLLRWLLSRLAVLLVVAALLGRVRGWLRRGARVAVNGAGVRDVLPSLYDLHPGALQAPRRRLGVRAVPLDAIVGTLRHPSQNTADFRPLPQLRGENWQARWQRITRATDRLAVLPPIDVVKVGDDYYVADGHNRVAAAREAGVVEIDADVTELVLPGIEPDPYAPPPPSTLMEADELRPAARGRHSPTAERRPRADGLTRRELELSTEAPLSREEPE
jgi:ParB-like nuclease domain